MRRRVMHSLIVSMLLAPSALAQSRPAAVDRQGFPDSIVVNGKIVTMDDRSATPDRPGHIVEAMAIKGKKIMALGTNAEMRALAGPETKTVDVGGRTVIPGLIQTHYHLFGPAATRHGPSQGLTDPSVKLTVVAEKDVEATVKKVRDTVVNAIEVQKIPKGQWITVSLQPGKDNPNGEIRSWFFGRKINKRQFDSAVKEHPVLISGGANGVFNTAGVEAFKKVFPDWEESTDSENGEGSGANGFAAVPDVGGMTFEFWWKDKPVQNLSEALRLYGLDLQKMGMTSVETRILYPTVIAAYHKLNREGKMPHRLAYAVESQRGNFLSVKSSREFYRASGAPWVTHSAGNEMLWLHGMSNEVWDASNFEGCLGPDVPAPAEIKARERCPKPGSRPWEAVKTAIVYGWRPVQVHSVGSHGARLYLQMMEEAMKEGNLSVEHMRGLRTTMEHNPVLGAPPDVIAGIKKYGIILNVNPGNLTGIPELLKDYGEKLNSFVMPVRTWMDNGIRVTFEAAGADFWTPIHLLVTREVKSGTGKVVLNPEQRIDRVTALKMTTTWASEYLLAEDTIGTLEPGKFADFTVLDKDFFTIPTEEIPKLRAVMTGLGGVVVWDNRAGDQKWPERLGVE